MDTPRMTSRTYAYLDGALVGIGLATTHKGVTAGHVDVYLAGSLLAVSSTDPQPLRELAAALVQAADELEANRQAVA